MQHQSEELFVDSHIWKSVIQELTKHYGEAGYNSWFSKMVPLKQGSSLLIVVPSNFIRDWIKTNYLENISSLCHHYDSNIKKIELVTRSSRIESHKKIQIQPITPEKRDNPREDNQNFLGSGLDPRFTFDNFVVGVPNELAYAASRAIAESKNSIAESNPLFLYGGVGLGKTHLMHAVAWYIRKHEPKRKVIYMSAEKFMYQFINALRNKDVMAFKEKFRSVDVLMIDDIQFICGKESTQEEFFHTFNALIDNNKQMVISCDRSPSDLDNIEDRIKSRLGWGLVADVHSTTYELRLGILKSKVEQMEIEVSQVVLEFLATKITSNVRELEGALNKVIAHSTLVGKDINLENTQDLLRDLLRSNERIITIDNIQKKVAERYNIKVSDMSSQRRNRMVARPRQIAMYLAKTLTPRSLTDIAKKFGKKDHTTVMHAIKKVEELLEMDAELKEEVGLLMRVLQN